MYCHSNLTISADPDIMPRTPRVSAAAFLVVAAAAVLVQAPNYIDVSDSRPLIISHFLPNQAEKARQLARVDRKPIFGNLGNEESYSGFITVNQKYNTNYFFWFFPANDQPERAPVVLWIQGGPATSGLRAVFLENGPFEFENGNYQWVHKRQHHLTRDHSVIYVDKPAGAGFSFTGSEKGYARDDAQIVDELVEFLRQFFMVFPDFRSREFYVAGQSYGGKLSVLLGEAIARRQSKINLHGVIVANGIVDPSNQIDKSDLYFQLGLVDDNGREEMKSAADKMKELFEEGKINEAYTYIRDECVGTISPDKTGHTTLSNLLLLNDSQDRPYEHFLNLTEVREALHTDKTAFNPRSRKAGSVLRPQMWISAASALERLLDVHRKRVLVAGGMYDLCIPHSTTIRYLNKMNWKGSQEYKLADRKLWKIRGDLAGYVKQGANLTEVFIKSCGHYLAQDQPEYTVDMFQRFTRGLEF